MFSFGEFYSLQGEKSNYSVWELSLFMLIGAMGGLIGACFNSLNLQLFQWRKTFLPAKKFYLRLVEAVCVVIVMSLFAFLLPLLWSKCTPLPTDMEGWSDQEKTLVTELVCMYCKKGTHYNELASLYLTDSDTSIKQLFHFREIGDDNVSTFSSFALFQFVVPYIFMACITNGVSVPAGTYGHASLFIVSYIKLYYIISYYIMLYYIMLHYIILYHICCQFYSFIFFFIIFYQNALN